MGDTAARVDLPGAPGDAVSQSGAPHVDGSDPASTEPGSAETLQPAPAARSRSKRALDLGLTLVALPVILAVGLVIAILVAITSRGPVFFVQDRVGLDGLRFRMVKFRTMQPDAEAQVRADPGLWEQYVRNDYKLPAEDSRMTRVGRLLRRSSLDELPQIVNVIRGQMSLVGPRPVVPEELELYGAHRDAYLSVRPGITGWWQVNGRSGVGYPERVACDRRYASEWSFWLDIRLLLRTPLAVVSRRGAH